MPKKEGVFPCYENQFQAGASIEELHDIADMETFSVAIDNNIEEWKPYDQKGWTRRLLTGKSVTISVTGKRNIGDAGNDYVADKALAEGRDAEGYFQWTFPDGTKILFKDAVFSITALNAAESTNVGPLEFEVASNGKPEITAAAVVSLNMQKQITNTKTATENDTASKK